MPWTNEQTTTLIYMHKAGRSAGEIAKELAMSRNSVCGKIDRLRDAGKIEGTTPRPKPMNPPGRPKKLLEATKAPAKAMKPAKPAKLPVVIAKIDERTPIEDGLPLEADTRFLKSQAWEKLEGSTPVPLEELKKNECSWPLGDGPFLFCALPKHDSRYCATHAHLSKARISAVPAKPFRPRRVSALIV